MYYSGWVSEAEDIIEKVNEDFSNIFDWARLNALVVNIVKTQAMWIGSTGFLKQLHNLRLADINFNSAIIEPCEILKVLGVTLDRTLSWKEQCNSSKKVRCLQALCSPTPKSALRAAAFTA